MELNLRPAAVAGQFYPEDKKELKKIIEGFLTEARSPKIEGEIFGLLLPHAGYMYSGQVAAEGFKMIAGKSFDTVIIIGDSHYERFDGVAVWPKGAWQTPLGEVDVDEGLAKKILSSSKRFIRRDSAHLWEHSIEAQLPFLQKVLKNFKILPVIFGSEDKDWRVLAETILENIRGKKVLIIASSDLSHYLPSQKAKKTDKRTLKNILGLKTQNLEVCAPDSAKTLIEIAKNLRAKTKLLKYTYSKVGYASAVFYHSLTRFF